MNFSDGNSNVFSRLFGTTRSCHSVLFRFESVTRLLVFFAVVANAMTGILVFSVPAFAQSDAASNNEQFWLSNLAIVGFAIAIGAAIFYLLRSGDNNNDPDKD